MADHSKEKAEWLRKVRDEIRPAYARLFSSGRLILQCDDGSEVAIRFTKGVLPIYVGLNTTWTSIRDVVPGNRISMTTSYEGILRRSAWTTPIDIATGTRHTKSGGVIPKSKLDIAGEAFNHVASAAYVVESAKSGLILFAGDERWALGLSEQVNKKDERTG